MVNSGLAPPISKVIKLLILLFFLLKTGNPVNGVYQFGYTIDSNATIKGCRVFVKGLI